jgi:hypothetical protein
VTVKNRFLGGALCLLVLGASCSGPMPGIGPRPSSPVTASTVLTPDRGSLVFSDSFNDSNAGWSRDSTADFNASFTGAGYVVVVRRYVDHEIAVPYVDPKDQLSVAVTATESPGSPALAGLGVGCVRGLTDPTVHYTFVVMVGGTWNLYRHDERPGAASPHTLLKQGTSPKKPGPISLTVELMCATLADGVTTRLAMYVNSTQVADIADPVKDLPRLGWLGSLVVRGDDPGPTTVTATHFEERDLQYP